MKATELIKKLEKIIKKHGDCEIYTMYDSNDPGSGCLDFPDSARFYKKIRWNGYSEFSDFVNNAIVLE